MQCTTSSLMVQWLKCPVSIVAYFSSLMIAILAIREITNVASSLFSASWRSHVVYQWLYNFQNISAHNKGNKETPIFKGMSKTGSKCFFCQGM